MKALRAYRSTVERWVMLEEWFEKSKSTGNLTCFEFYFAVTVGNVSESKLQFSTKELKNF